MKSPGDVPLTFPLNINRRNANKKIILNHKKMKNLDQLIEVVNKSSRRKPK